MSGPLHFKRHLVIELVPSEGLFVLSEAGEQVFRGPVFVRVAALIDGRNSDDEIAGALAGEIAPARVYFAIASLRRAGFVTDRPSVLPRREAALWDALGVETHTVTKKPTLGLVHFGGVDVESFANRLTTVGFALRPDDVDCTLVLVDDYLRAELDDFDDRARATDRTWLLAKPHGLEAWIGPLFRPGRAGCWLCLAHRLRGHRRVQHFLQAHTGRTDPYATSIAATSATVEIVSGALAAALHRYAALPDDEHPLDGAVVSLAPLELSTRVHQLVARPQCPRCGDPQLVARLQSRPITLSSQPAKLRDGGRRAEAPADTFARLEHHISPITGIVSRMIRSSPPDAISHSYYTDHNFVHMTRNLEFLRISLRSYSGGKGRTAIQAKTGALCESIERYSSVRRGDEATRTASYAQLRDAGELVVHPNAIMLYSDAQLAERERWNATGELFCWVPDRFDEHAEIPWTPAWSPGDARPRWIATGLCFYDANTPMMRADSNGCAAGSSVEEAILQGFLELVERDAVALWWYNRLELAGVDLDSFAEPYLLAARAELAALGRELWVLELPTDFAIPCYAAVSRRPNHAHEELVFGLGAHFDATLAVARALAEHNQFLPFAKIDNHSPSSVPGRWYREATIASEPYLRPAPGRTPRRRDDHPRDDRGDLRAEIERCMALARGRGLELLVQDHTRPDTGLSVVKVIVPGLRHFWARFGPGRLYDVPVQLGLREQPTPERELNPTPVFV